MPRLLSSLVCVPLVFTLISDGVAAEPLHARVDRIIDATRIGPQAGLCSDEVFLRRVYLDFTGVIPPAEEARAFLADSSPDKRTKLVDRLLGSPEYVRHMTDVFSVMLMERRSDPDNWRAYLTSSFEQNRPWNRMAAEILGADGVDPEGQGPVNYYIARGVEPNLMTREVGRMFFGMDLECAQCHNHPLIDDYLQRDYYGIFAFLSRTYQFTVDKKPPVLAEKAEGDANFESVFTGIKGSTLPRLPGEGELNEPSFKKGEEYKVKPDPKQKNVRPVPSYSRRARLSELAARGENLAFRRNIANRLWAQMMGRGLVHPPDLHHSDNPPSHPELLDLLAGEFAAMKFDIRAFLRELALTKVYQRSVALPANLTEQAKTMAPRLTELGSEQARLEAQGAAMDKQVEAAETEREFVRAELIELDDESKKATAAVASAKKAMAPLVKALDDAKKQLAAAGAKPNAPQAEVDRWSKTVAEKEKALKAVTDAQAAAEKVIAGMPARRAEIQKRVGAVADRVQMLTKQRGELRLAIKVARRRTETVQAMMDYAKLLHAKDANPDALNEAYDLLTKHWSEQFVVGVLEPLSPEQLAWSVMQATGLIENLRVSSAAALNRKKPLKPDEQKDPVKVAAREKEIEKDVQAKLLGNVKAFVTIFGAGSGQPQHDFFATAEQVLFFANGNEVRGWLSPSGNNLTARLAKLDSPEKLAEELYLSVLTRRPTQEEVGDVKAYLAARPTAKSEVVQEMAWALVTSSEFRFHH